jgi:hypothetical protein
MLLLVSLITRLAPDVLSELELATSRFVVHLQLSSRVGMLAISQLQLYPLLLNTNLWARGGNNMETGT